MQQPYQHGYPAGNAHTLWHKAVHHHPSTHRDSRSTHTHTNACKGTQAAFCTRLSCSLQWHVAHCIRTHFFLQHQPSDSLSPVDDSTPLLQPSAAALGCCNSHLAPHARSRAVKTTQNSISNPAQTPTALDHTTHIHSGVCKYFCSTRHIRFPIRRSLRNACITQPNQQQHICAAARSISTSTSATNQPHRAALY
jgi:hypothetical protein